MPHPLIPNRYWKCDLYLLRGGRPCAGSIYQPLRIAYIRFRKYPMWIGQEVNDLSAIDPHSGVAYHRPPQVSGHS